MVYRQDDVERTCVICQELIRKNEPMMDLFRAESSDSGSDLPVQWTHLTCVKTAVETWLKRKWGKVLEQLPGSRAAEEDSLP